jgi:outer membrane protein assembly factor BamB
VHVVRGEDDVGAPFGGGLGDDVDRRRLELDEEDVGVGRVDVRSQRVAKVVPGLDQGPSTLALGAGGLWVVCARGVGRLDRLDPATSELVARYDIEWWSNAVAVDGDGVYVRGTNGGDVSRLDPASGRIEWTQPGPGFIGRNGIDQIAVSPEGVWIGGPTTVRMDPRTGRALETLPLASTSIAAARDEVWLVQLDGSVTGFRRR